MSKSTPLENLPSLQQQAPQMQGGEPSPAYEENENQLVNEILQEIEGNSQAPQQAPQQAPPIQMEISPEQAQQEQLIQQQMMHDQQLMNQQANQSLTDNILDLVKLPAIVGVIVIALSIPQVSNVLSSLIPKKEVLTKNINLIIPLLKGIIASVLYFSISRTL